MMSLPGLGLASSCGRLACGRNWCRTRENSLALKDWEFWLVWRGRGWMATLGEKFEIGPGFCALMRPGGIYDAGHDSADPLGITYIHFDWLRRVSPEQLPEFFRVDDVEFYDALSR